MIDQLRPLLLYLEKEEECTWEVEPKDTDRFVYRLRNALNLARSYQARYPALAKASALFSLDVIEPGLIQATRRATLPPVPRKLDARHVGRPRADGGSARPTGRTTKHSADVHVQDPTPIVLPQARSRFEVIDAWTKEQPTTRTILFPEADLSLEDLDKLARWAKTRRPVWQIGTSGTALALSVAPQENPQHGLL